MFDDHLLDLNNFAEPDCRTKDQPCQNTVQSVLDRELTQAGKKARNIIHDAEAKAKQRPRFFDYQVRTLILSILTTCYVMKAISTMQHMLIEV